MEKKKIILVGYGWASLGFIQHIDINQYELILISKHDHFLYTPLLAQTVKHDKNIIIHVDQLKRPLRFIQQNVERFDFDKKTVQEQKYDFVIFAHGSEVNTFNIPGVQENTFYLKTLEDSIKIKKHLHHLHDDSVIAVIGCGLAGTELIGSILDMRKFKILAIDALDRPVTMFDKTLSEKVVKLWEKENIQMYFQSLVQKINKDSLVIKDKPVLNFDMAIWCGGIKMSKLSKQVNDQLQLENNRGIPVDKYLQINGQTDLFAIGDCAFSGNPPTAQVAYQQGIYLAKQFNQQLPKKQEFVFQDKGQIGYIGNGNSIYQNNYYKGGGTLMYYFNNLVHLYNFGKIYVKSKI